MKHLTDAELSASLDGRLSDRARLKADRHLAECVRCRDLLASMAEQDRALGQALSHDPGEAYFETFASRVETRLRAAGLAGAQARAFSGRAGIGSWLRGPRGLAWAGTIAALVIGAGVVFMMAREIHVPALLKPELEKREAQVAREPKAPGTPAEAPPGARRGTPTEGSKEAVQRREAAGPEQASTRALAKTEPLSGSARQDRANAVQPSRAIEVRRDEHGEEVPVRRPGAFALPPSRSAVPGAGTGLRSAKPRPGPLAAGEAFRALAKESLASQFQQSDDRLSTGENRPGATAPLCGIVRDYSGRPVSSAQVMLADVALTATTNSEGRFCLTAPLGSHMLSVLAVGFEPVRRSIDVGAKASETEIALQAVTVLPGPSGLARREAGNVSGRMMLGADSFAGWPQSARELAVQAQRHMVQAEAVGSAAMFDRAASSWERTLKETHGGDPELKSRQRLSEARFRAWEATPTSKRASAAIEALTSYLVRAPGGAGRDSALRQLNRIKR